VYVKDMVFVTLRNITNPFIGAGTDCNSPFFLTKHFTYEYKQSILEPWNDVPMT